MRKLALFVAFISFTGACTNKDKTRVLTEEEAPRMATMLTMQDPRAPTQLLLGFYSLEPGNWRWTAGHFSVVLRPPRDAKEAGAAIKLKFSIPPAVLDRVKSTSLTAQIGTLTLPAETYNKPGDYEYRRDVPGSAFTSDPIKVDFSLSQFLAAGTVEGRELGVIATAVGFEHK